VVLPDAVLDRLRAACAVVDTGDAERVEAGRDWWPLAFTWARQGQVPALPAAVARPTTTAEVAAVVAVCGQASVPVTAAAGRSGVCGGSIPKLGGVALDLRGLAGLVDVDHVDLVATARAGTNGLAFEESLRAEGLTSGHWPQSIALSSVGGWAACRGAGQYSTRYGKAEDMVVGLEVVLADGSVVCTGGRGPREAAGPDLTQLFVGSEGTLGLITEVSMRIHPVARAERLGAWSFPSFGAGLDACRSILRRGATPAVLRLYDDRESKEYGGDGHHSVLLVLDEGEPALIDATMAIVGEECAGDGAAVLDGEALLGRWLRRRNDVSALGHAIDAGLVVDTCEIAARWSALPAIHADACAAAAAAGAFVVSAHQSHAYPDGACLYFTFAGAPAGGLAGGDAFYADAWGAIVGASLAHGGTLSHHHGVGLNRARYLPGALGPAFGVLAAVKAALDPAGILNPGGLGLPSPLGAVAWP
jgi:alkyldihydroxyacetonephosphate synthase